ncbi:MAG TPA: class I SAM-dependent methyltransferase [Euryarchaeota archaeon]|nr:class I SAM-dependent methyltransferase [Euryarchaeota archaeon]
MRPDFDRLADIYDETRCCSPELTGRVVDHLKELLGTDSSLLEIGAGTGRFLAPIGRAGIAAFGADISVEMIRRARSKGLKDLLLADGCHLPFNDESFDGTMIVNVLHLVGEWGRLLTEAARVSRKAVIAVDIRTDDSDPYNIMRKIFERNGMLPINCGPTEKELADSCAPDSKIDLGSFTEHQRREDLISAFDRRSYAFQTSIDDSAHEELMKEFSETLTADDIAVVRSVEMFLWRPRRIALFALERTFG